jgi:hypothetical protein
MKAEWRIKAESRKLKAEQLRHQPYFGGFRFPLPVFRFPLSAFSFQLSFNFP